MHSSRCSTPVTTRFVSFLLFSEREADVSELALQIATFVWSGMLIFVLAEKISKMQTISRGVAYLSRCRCVNVFGHWRHLWKVGIGFEAGVVDALGAYMP
jgi:hypothetical protein